MKDVIAQNTDVLTRVGEEMLTWLQAGKEVVTENAPLLANEIVERGLVYHYMGGGRAALFLLIALIGGGFVIYLLTKGFKVNREKDSVAADPYFVASLILGLISYAVFLISSGVLFNHVRAALMIEAAPKYYIIEQLSKLVN